MDVLGGNAIPKGCQGCGATWEALNQVPGLAVRIYIVPKDGIQALLCEDCVRPYTAKRADIYRGTKYGRSLNL